MIEKILFFLRRAGSARRRYTGNDVLREIRRCFISSIPDLSVGERMLYNTSFNVLLHPADYAHVKQLFPFLATEAAKMMEKIIDEYRSKGQYDIYDAPSNNWFFQFSRCERFNPGTESGGEIAIGPSKSFIVGALYSLAMGNNTKQATNVKVSLRSKNSRHYAVYDINPNVFVGIDAIGSDTFKVRMKTGQVFSAREEYALIKYNGLDFKMEDKEIIISSEPDFAKTNILYIKDTNVSKDHARIKYDPMKRQFTIAAFNFVRLNGVILPLSSGSSMTWIELPDTSEILVGSRLLPVALNFFSKI